MWGDRETKSPPLIFTAVGLSAVNRARSPLYSLPFIYPTSLMPSSDAPWRLTYEIGSHAWRSNARHACRLHPVEEPSVGKQAALTRPAAEWLQPPNQYRCHIAVRCSMCRMSPDFTMFDFRCSHRSFSTACVNKIEHYCNKVAHVTLLPTLNCTGPFVVWCATLSLKYRCRFFL